jgi:hypothetical protein
VVGVGAKGLLETSKETLLRRSAITSTEVSLVNNFIMR